MWSTTSVELWQEIFRSGAPSQECFWEIGVQHRDNSFGTAVSWVFFTISVNSIQGHTTLPEDTRTTPLPPGSSFDLDVSTGKSFIFMFHPFLNGCILGDAEYEGLGLRVAESGGQDTWTFVAPFCIHRVFGVQNPEAWKRIFYSRIGCPIHVLVSKGKPAVASLQKKLWWWSVYLWERPPPLRFLLPQQHQHFERW